jgi:hypothetical protein
MRGARGLLWLMLKTAGRNGGRAYLDYRSRPHTPMACSAGLLYWLV